MSMLSYWGRLHLISAMLLPYCDDGGWEVGGGWMILLGRVMEIRAAPEHEEMQLCWDGCVMLFVHETSYCGRVKLWRGVGVCVCVVGGRGGARLTSLSVVKTGVMVNWARDELLLRAEEDKVSSAFLQTMIMIVVKKKKHQKNHINVDTHGMCCVECCMQTHCGFGIFWLWCLGDRAQPLLQQCRGIFLCMCGDYK